LNPISQAVAPHNGRKYRPDIDGLRAVAVTSVVAYHAGLGWIKGGFVGVDIFFVISGYLIGSLIYQEIRAGGFSIARFYERRAKRILPALFGVLLFCYAAGLLLLPWSEMRHLVRAALATILSSSNVLFWLTSDYFAPLAELNTLLMTWSLGVEEQFYLLFPLLMLLLRRFSAKVQYIAISCMVATSLAMSIFGTAYNPTAAFFLLPTRAWELGAGVLLAIYEINRWEINRGARKSRMSRLTRDVCSLTGFILICLAVCLLNASVRFPGYAALLPVAGALLIIAARKGVINRLLSLRPLVFIGLVSYSWYLWHWPLLSFARNVAPAGIPVQTGVCIAAISFGLAVLSYKFIEQPFRRSTIPTIPLLKRYALGSLIVALPAVVIFVTHWVPNGSGFVQKIDTLDSIMEKQSCMVDEAASHLNITASCLPPLTGPTVALIGDSHAATFVATLREVALSSGYQTVEMTKASCPALDGVTRAYGGSGSRCTEFNRKRLDYIERSPNIRVVFVVSFWSAPLAAEGDYYALDGSGARTVSFEQSHENFELGLDRLVTRLEKAGKTIYLFQDNPEFEFDPPRLMITRLVKARLALSRLVAPSTPLYADNVAPSRMTPGVETARAVIDEIAAGHPAVHVIDSWNVLCKEPGCRFADGSEIFYVDDQHLSNYGAGLVLSTLQLPPVGGHEASRRERDEQPATADADLSR
jgi:peptidoglycan/LPS O-acetylase OafA/YrhL